MGAGEGAGVGVVAAASVEAEVICSSTSVERAAVEPRTGGTPSGPVNREGVRPVKARHPTWLSTGLVIVVVVTVVGETVGETVGESVGETAAGVENTDGTPVIPTTHKGPHPPDKPPPKVTTFEE